MIDLSELHAQNHRLTEISNVLLYLAEDRALCDTETARGLFLDYVRETAEHLKQVDRMVKLSLLASADPFAQNLGRRMTADSSLLRRNVEDYYRQWSDGPRRPLHFRDHGDFVDDTRDLFNLFLDRIQRETELLYPLLRKLEQTGRLAA